MMLIDALKQITLLELNVPLKHHIQESKKKKRAEYVEAVKGQAEIVGGK